METKNAVRAFSLLFLAASVADAFAPPAFHPWLKGSLMPLLAVLLLSSGKSVPQRGLILGALFCAWSGDILLLFEQKSPMFFITGLSAFLMAHLLYIRYFLKVPGNTPSLLRVHPWIGALVAAYGVSLLNILWPRLGDMKLPVAVYAVVICTMIICSLHAYTRSGKPAGSLFILGALLFALSDSLLAINKFYAPFQNAGAAIMLTYCAAQFCIISGVIRMRTNTPAAGGVS